MSIIGFLTGKNPQRVVISRDGTGAPGLTLDAAISITTSRQVSLTKNPVESGGNITDHATLGNLTLSIEGLISEAPLPSGLLESALGIAAGAAGGLIGTVVGGAAGGLAGSLATAGAAAGANALISGSAASLEIKDGIPSAIAIESHISKRAVGDTDYPRKAFTYLLALQKDRLLVNVVTRLHTYKSLIITDISVPQVISDGKSIRFTASFEQVQIVKSASVTLPESVIAKNAGGAASKGNLGKQATSAATEAQGGNVSILKSIIK